MKLGVRLFCLLLVLVTLFSFVSCKKIQRNEIPSGEQELPDMILNNATYIFGEKARRPLVMEAQTITIFTGSNGRTLLEKATFVQEEKDTNGQTYTELEGRCDSASINEKNTIAKLEGNVRLVKKSDNFEIQCERLEWNDESQIISTDSDVRVVYGDGTELKAIGFSAQLNDNIYEFGEIIEGRYVNE